jgi:hypothetical protein
LALLLGTLATWGVLLALWWKSKFVRAVLIGIACIPLILFSLPGRNVEASSLANDVCQTMRSYEGVRYIWGGEGYLGIDCSGLVRKGMIWGGVRHGVRTLNGRPIRASFKLWWNDFAAGSLLDDARNRTVELYDAPSISVADYSRLKPGDLAVTRDGVHVLAHLGDRTWIEADPDHRQVVMVTLPTENPWFSQPVKLVRWRELAGASMEQTE